MRVCRPGRPAARFSATRRQAPALLPPSRRVERRVHGAAKPDDSPGVLAPWSQHDGSREERQMPVRRQRDRLHRVRLPPRRPAILRTSGRPVDAQPESVCRAIPSACRHRRVWQATFHFTKGAKFPIGCLLVQTVPISGPGGNTMVSRGRRNRGSDAGLHRLPRTAVRSSYELHSRQRPRTSTRRDWTIPGSAAVLGTGMRSSSLL